MRLDEDRLALAELIQETGDHYHILYEYVEKDYWLVLLLKQIMNKDSEYVFKGGTSLSKCYRLINRFSEDIDISYSSPYNAISISKRENKFRGIYDSILEVGLSIENQSSLRRRRYFNQFICPYPTLLNGGVVDNNIIIELAAQTPSFPSSKQKIQSFIGEYLSSIGHNDIVEQYELEPFYVNTQSLERTIVDKTFAMCDYYLSNKVRKHSRHIYDIHKILPNISLDESLAKLFTEVRKYREKISICYSAKDGVKLFNVLGKIVKDNVFEDDYNKSTLLLLYDSISYKDCLNSLNQLYLFLKENNL